MSHCPIASGLSGQSAGLRSLGYCAAAGHTGTLSVHSFPSTWGAYRTELFLPERRSDVMRGFAAETIDFRVLRSESRTGLTFDDLAGVGLRRNPKRVHLIVSRVLAKHLPVSGSVAVAAARSLADEVLHAWDGPMPDNVLVLGFAETACGLAGLVADALPGTVLTQTTRDVGDAPGIWLQSEEAHSHAPSHFLLRGVHDALSAGPEVVLVDDELSTGETVWRVISQVNRAFPNRRYVIACLIDARPDSDRERLRRRSEMAGVDVRVASLLDVRLSFAEDAPAKVARFLAEPSMRADQARSLSPQRVRPLPLSPAIMPDARIGAGFADRVRAGEVLDRQLDTLARNQTGAKILVIGVEEAIYPAVRVAVALGADVQSTTRSPAVVIDRQDYPLRSGVTFPSEYSPDIPAFLYNGPATAGEPAYDQTVVMLPDTHRPQSRVARAELLAAAGSCCTGTVWTWDLRRSR